MKIEGLKNIISGAFASWYEGKSFTDDQKQTLYSDSLFVDYDNAGDYFQACGWIDDDGELTEAGSAIIKEHAAGADPSPGDVAPASSVGSHSGDNGIINDLEARQISAEEWAENGYYAVIVDTVEDLPILDKNAEHRHYTAIGYDDYVSTREDVHFMKWCICRENFQTKADYFPGYLDFETAERVFLEADESYLELKSFPKLSEMLKIRKHDTVALAADTGAGKSSLALNFINDLNDDYPVIYFNLEMDMATVLRRLVSIRSGLELDRVEGYKKDADTRRLVNAHLHALTSRKMLQVVNDNYYVEQMEETIARCTANRQEQTIVIIDHSLLAKTKQRHAGRYERFTMISEEIRRISREYNIIVFILLQQNRDGKATEEQRPTNSSLKETGSWENDATHIIFLWYDPGARKERLIITKNRSGQSGVDVLLNYWKKTQIFTEAKIDDQDKAESASKPAKMTPREKMRDKLKRAIEIAMIKTDGNPTLFDIAEAGGVRTSTVKGWLKEFGDVSINGFPVDPAGIDDVVECTGFIRVTLNEAEEIEDSFKHFG